LPQISNEFSPVYAKGHLPPPQADGCPPPGQAPSAQARVEPAGWWAAKVENFFWTFLDPQSGQLGLPELGPTNNSNSVWQLWHAYSYIGIVFFASPGHTIVIEFRRRKESNFNHFSSE
jgi:hypothetical protein